MGLRIAPGPIFAFRGDSLPPEPHTRAQRPVFEVRIECSVTRSRMGGHGCRIEHAVVLAVGRMLVPHTNGRGS